MANPSATRVEFDCAGEVGERLSSPGCTACGGPTFVHVFPGAGDDLHEIFTRSPHVLHTIRLAPTARFPQTGVGMHRDHRQRPVLALMLGDLDSLCFLEA